MSPRRNPCSLLRSWPWQAMYHIGNISESCACFLWQKRQRNRCNGVGCRELLSSTNLSENVEPGGAEDQSSDLSGSAEAGATQKHAPNYCVGIRVTSTISLQCIYYISCMRCGTVDVWST